MCPSSLVLTLEWPITVWIYSQDKLYYNPTLLDPNVSNEMSQTFLSTFLSHAGGISPTYDCAYFHSDRWRKFENLKYFLTSLLCLFSFFFNRITLITDGRNI